MNIKERVYIICSILLVSGCANKSAVNTVTSTLTAATYLFAPMAAPVIVIGLSEVSRLNNNYADKLEAGEIREVKISKAEKIDKHSEHLPSKCKPLKRKDGRAIGLSTDPECEKLYQELSL